MLENVNGTPPVGDYVLTNFRYLSAYNELVARIGQRQQTLTLFVAIFTGLVTAIVALRELFKTNHDSIVWIMIGFPCASIALTFLNYKYELLLSILREYLADLERVKDAHLSFPSYNCDETYLRRANQARYFHDLTCAFLIVAYNTAAIGIYVALCGEAVKPSIIVIGTVALIALICFVAHLLLWRVHYRFGKAKPLS